ncbi:MAG: phosphoribosylformylglycinamidine synthase subunit PurL [Proteobacteria bacterium]|nr:phosphoribosylformylglycinamidine synthase subunit PurL [Pseudomonadota bacterium]
MAHRIEVGLKDGVRDALGEKMKRRVCDDLHIPVQSVHTIEVFTIDMDLGADELKALAAGPFSDPIVQVYAIDRPLARDFDWLIEVGLRPGVTDNVGRTALEALVLLLGRNPGQDEKVYASRQYLICGDLDRNGAERIARDLLANELIQHFEMFQKNSFDYTRGVPLTVYRVTGGNRIEVCEIDLSVSDDELVTISRERLLALNLEEMKAIQAYFSNPDVVARRHTTGLGAHATDVELEALAQTWSEHCKHKIFNADIEYSDDTGSRILISSLFDTYIKGVTEQVRKKLGDRDWCVSVFTDNAGVIKWDDRWNLVFKVETHNSPSALDPYGGALTGIVGVNRDPLGTGMGAKLIFNTDVFCFASPFYDGALPARILHPRRIYEGVREGVEHGGNKSGIPTVNGSIVFDDRFMGKPLVYCGTAGIMPGEILGRPAHTKEVRPGDLIVMAGGRIGKDGIHGATFSSEELHEGSPVTAVQIGDPITQKRMMDCLLEARDRGLYRCITDNGAGGLSSSVGEMAQFSNGCELDLKQAPLKYSGLQPWEILLSEAQERMTLAIPPEKIDDFMNLTRMMGVEATVLGRFTDSGCFHIRYGDKTVACLDMHFLHKGLPRMQLKAAWKPPRHEEPDIKDPVDLTPALRRMLSRLNICSKESVVRQYDHEVQGGSVVKPLSGITNDGPSDAAVLRPVLDSLQGVVVSHGICPRYSDIDTYHMTACAIDEALRNFLCVGGSFAGIAGLDNFCWCDPLRSEKNPDGEYKLAQLVRANRALFDYAIAYAIPLISGKDSMKNDYVIGEQKISIPPTVLFSIIGKIDDVRKAVTMDAKAPGDLVYVLGETFDEMGGSEYYALHGYTGNRVPTVNAERALKLYRRLTVAREKGLVQSCHDCSDGGLGVALAETAFSGGLGMMVDVKKVPAAKITRNDILLFSETQSRFVVTVSAGNKKAFERCMGDSTAAEIGVLLEEPRFKILGLKGSIAVDATIFDLKECWQKTLRF